jgi:MFS family permease
MLCLARTVSLLVVGRIFQGAAAAIVWTVGQALLVDTVGQKEIGQTLGWVSISMSMSILIAPLLGGVVYNKAGYYPVYYMAFGLIALDIFGSF